MTGIAPRAVDAPTPVRADDALEVPATSFDFLEGRFRAAARSRLANTLLVGVLAVVVALVVSNAVGARLQAASDTDRVDALAAAVDADHAEIEALRQAGRATEGEVRAHVATRATSAATAAQAQQPYADALGAIFALPGASVRSATLTVDGDATTVTVTGASPSPQAATAAAVQLDDPGVYPFLTRTVQTQVQCITTDTADACTWVWTGKFNPASPTPRSEAFTSAYGVTPASPPAPPPALQAGQGDE